MKLKETLQMPVTDFAMKGNLANREPLWQKQWEENEVYKQVMEKNKGRELFVLHDGPPYANGDLHLGHALNKILKDIIVRSKNANGYLAPMIHGWDTHGLPIENALLKNKKIKRQELTDVEFRRLCRDYALDQVQNQKQQFSTLGLLADPEKHYVTLDPKFEAEQIKVFAEIVKKDLIYKGLKPVYWSPSSQSALAEAEIEYQEKTSPAIYVGMDLIDFDVEDSQIVIWTTTPWTIPANMGVAVGDNFEYSLVNFGTKNYLVASDLVEPFLADLAKKDVDTANHKIVKTYVGSELEGYKIKHPLFEDRITKVMIGHHVTVDSGTGCVHIAPGHGEDDFIIGKKYGLEVFSVVDAFGKMNDNSRDYQGVFYEDANKEIGERLASTGNLLALNFLKHSYPHDWRTKKPVLFRATAQWFCSITPVKAGILNEIENVEYADAWAKVRLHNMIEGREEWCISRQRKWGVPIPIFYTEKEEPIMDYDLILHIADLFKEHGSDIWFEKEAKDLLPKGYTHPDSPNGVFTKEQDIMDVWFDSGSSHAYVVNEMIGAKQADLYLEGSDQYRGWFNSSLITSYIARGHAPYKKLVSHGFTLDGKGNKMSKSLGNIIVPKQITQTQGADILRLWVASVDYSSDVPCSNELIMQISEVYRRYRNTIKFLLGTVSGFDNHVAVSELEDIDKYMLMRLSTITEEVKQAYEKFEFKKVLDLINNYIIVELSAFYMDFLKDVTYVDHKDSMRRRQILTVMDIHVDTLIKLMMPIIPHTTNEAYELYKGESVFLIDMPTIEIEQDLAILNRYNEFLTIRQDINKAIEILRNDKAIGKSLEAKVTIKPTAKALEVLNQIEDLDLLCIVSVFEVTDQDITGYESESGVILVEKYDGVECPRCRKYYEASEMESVMLEEEHTLCPRCLEVVKTYV